MKGAAFYRCILPGTLTDTLAPISGWGNQRNDLASRVRSFEFLLGYFRYPGELRPEPVESRGGLLVLFLSVVHVASDLEKRLLGALPEPFKVRQPLLHLAGVLLQLLAAKDHRDRREKS